MEQKESRLSIPGAIIIAGIIIAGAIFLYSIGGKDGAAIPKISATKEISVAAVTEKDRILGNPSAQAVLVEYSDLECPACKIFSRTINQITEKYGKDGKVAVVYRHFPLDRIHPKARKEAEASECAGELGGNAKFFAYVNRLFEVTPSNNGLEPAELPKIAAYVGLDKTKFDQCLSNGKHAEKVENDFQSGVTTGVNATPTSFLLLNAPISGAAKENLINEAKILVDRNGNQLVKIGSDDKVISIAAAMPFEIMDKILGIVLGK